MLFEFGVILLTLPVFALSQLCISGVLVPIGTCGSTPEYTYDFTITNNGVTQCSGAGTYDAATGGAIASCISGVSASLWQGAEDEGWFGATYSNFATTLSFLTTLDTPPFGFCGAIDWSTSPTCGATPGGF